MADKNSFLQAALDAHCNVIVKTMEAETRVGHFSHKFSIDKVLNKDDALRSPKELEKLLYLISTHVTNKTSGQLVCRVLWKHDDACQARVESDCSAECQPTGLQVEIRT